MRRRELILGSLSLPFAAAFAGLETLAAAREAALPFDDDTVATLARDLAARAYQPPPNTLPPWLAKIGYDQYRDYRYRPERALWRDDGLPFQAQFFHRGFLFKDRVDMHVVAGGRATPLQYSRDMFTYERSKVPDDRTLGFAGFRLHAPLNRPEYFDEVCTFLGASYFRAVAKGQGYGLSARGLALGSGDPGPEEFPVFKAFWLERPAPGARTIVVHALLDSPSAAASLRFGITPGEETLFDIDMRLHPRVALTNAGIAPLTSMFEFDAGDRVGVDDFRPAVHDTDGLAMLNGKNEQTWRPLRNPATLQHSGFQDAQPRGYGLMQRKRAFVDFVDEEAGYQRRPSAWVEPVGDWGAGEVHLVEIPTADEYHDNIVAFWRPRAPLAAGREHRWRYRLHWCADHAWRPELARVASTRSGAAAQAGTRLFVIDLAGGRLATLPASAKPRVQATASRGELRNAVAYRNPQSGGWVMSFEMTPGDAQAVELRAVLEDDAGALSETWLYRWNPVTGSVAPTAQATLALLPDESPLEMPIQSLGRGTLANPPRPSTPHAMRARRVYAIGGTAALTLLSAYQIWWLLRGDGIDVLEGVLLALFVALFAWIALAFVAAVPGFLHIVSRRRMRLGLQAQGALPALSQSTALLVPIYNEDPHRVLAGLQAILESLRATGQGDRFDAFVLSDTRNPAIAAAEEAAFAGLRAQLDGAQRVYYRRREHNSERKAGNIADWVRRFGGAHAHMLILDADSVMSGEIIVRMAGAMERHPDVALIQSLPVIVNGSTIFARMQQFASRVYGPVIAHGVAWWHGAESNYWGHNAIIRTGAFAAHAGLPELRGEEPFGGTVLSHDFVEAALMRRGGWALHMVPGLAGSYEEGPPSLTDMLVRDRRWCQGNLQHSAVLPARGLHWISRMHLLIGMGHYFTAPMWAMLMLVGLAIPLHAAGLSFETFHIGGFSPVAYWRAGDPQRFLWVFALTMGLLFAPKILGFGAMLLDRDLRRGCGGTLRATASLLLETVLAALMAPVTMYVQSRGVAEVLAGRDSGWESQRRDDGSLPLSGLLRSYGGLTVFGVVAGIAAYLVSPGLAAWMSPVIAGLVLSIPIVALTSGRRAGRWLQRARIFATPEESAPPPVLQRAAELRAQPHAPLPGMPEPHL